MISLKLDNLLIIFLLYIFEYEIKKITFLLRCVIETCNFFSQSYKLLHFSKFGDFYMMFKKFEIRSKKNLKKPNSKKKVQKNTYTVLMKVLNLRF